MSGDAVSPVSDDQREHFMHHGYVALPGFFAGDEVAALRVEVERFQREGLGSNVATAGDGATSNEHRVNYQIIPVNDKSTLMRALPFAARVRALVGALIGTPFARNLDQIFIKPARVGMGTGWHTDNGYFKLADPTKGMALWVALHDASVANGTLHVLPGSHRKALPHARDPDSNHHLTLVDRPTLAEGTPIELEAGGVVCFNYGVAHATGANPTAHERAGLAFHFVRSDFVATGDPAHFRKLVHVTGEDATGGEREYGVRVADAWPAEVAAVLGAVG